MNQGILVKEGFAVIQMRPQSWPEQDHSLEMGMGGQYVGFGIWRKENRLDLIVWMCKIDQWG